MPRSKLTRAEKDKIIAQMKVNLRHEAPTITRSDTPAAHALADDLGPSRVVKELRAMLEAVTTTKIIVRDEGGRYVDHRVVEVPDNRTRMAALDRLIRIHGYEFQPEKTLKIDPITLLIKQLPPEVQSRVTGVLTKYFPSTDGLL